MLGMVGAIGLINPAQGAANFGLPPSKFGMPISKTDGGSPRASPWVLPWAARNMAFTGITLYCAQKGLWDVVGVISRLP